MAAATKDRNTPIKYRQRLVVAKVKAATKIYAGTIVAADATGYAVPAVDTAAGTVLGIAEEYVDNSAGANGDKIIRVAKGVFKLANATALAVDQADVGKDVYADDDQTVRKTDATAGVSNNAVGKVDEIESDGVWVAIL